MRDIYVFGHKNPDTDSVTASISFSYLKNKMNMNTKPMILGKINKETEFVLKYFNFNVPEYLDDVKLRISDLNYYKDCYIGEYDSILMAYEYMSNKNITGVPIVDGSKKFKGLLTSKIITEKLIHGNYKNIHTSYDNIKKTLKAEETLKFDNEIDGEVIIASYNSSTIINNSILNNNTILIVGDRDSLIEAAVLNKIKLLIIVGNLDIKDEYLNKAKENKVNIIKTGYDTFYTAKLIGLSEYTKNLVEFTRNICVKEEDYYDDFKEMSSKLGYNNYPVIDNKNKCLGLVRITDIGKKNRKKVILVDHNESQQSVYGLNEAEILEIIDHHRIGDLTTNMPINFRNMTVGSTNTIIYLMFIENNINIPSDIAGLMLSGIISDTLKFTSPTTTEYDKYVASNLAEIAQIDIDSYSSKMFKEGTSLKGKSIDEIINSDLKIYEVDDKKIAIAQVITLNSEEILDKKEEYINEISNIKSNKEYDLFILSITDIINNGSYILYDNKSKNKMDEIFNDNVNQGYFYKGCLSRKKQLAPIVMNIYN